MNCILLARISLSFLCAIQGMATLAIDLNRTHAANPAWTGHARFHVVWQSASVALLSVLELALIWMRGPYREGGFYLASLLAAVSPLGFLIACATRRIFAGAPIGSQRHTAVPGDAVRRRYFHRHESRGGRCSIADGCGGSCTLPGVTAPSSLGPSVDRCGSAHRQLISPASLQAEARGSRWHRYGVAQAPVPAPWVARPKAHP